MGSYLQRKTKDLLRNFRLCSPIDLGRQRIWHERRSVVHWSARLWATRGEGTLLSYQPKRDNEKNNECRFRSASVPWKHFFFGSLIHPEPSKKAAWRKDDCWCPSSTPLSGSTKDIMIVYSSFFILLINNSISHKSTDLDLYRWKILTLPYINWIEIVNEMAPTQWYELPSSLRYPWVGRTQSPPPGPRVPNQNKFMFHGRSQNIGSSHHNPPLLLPFIAVPPPNLRRGALQNRILSD